SQIISELFLEAFLVAALGAFSGLLLAVDLEQSLRWLTPADFPGGASTSLGWSGFAFAAAAASLSAILFVMAPALHGMSGESLHKSLRDGTNCSRGGRRAVWKSLAVAQMGIAVVVCLGAGVLLRSFIRLNSVPLGFDPRDVLVVSTAINIDGDRGVRHAASFADETRTRIRSIPGVRYVGVSSLVPFSGGAAGYPITVDGKSSDENSRPEVIAQFVGGEYFQVLSIPLLSGRQFLPDEGSTAPEAVIINRSAARRYFNETSPIGHTIRLGNENKYTVVGVVGDARDQLVEAAPEPEIFLPMGKEAIWGQFSFILKTTADPDRIAGSARQVVRSIDPDVAIVRIARLEDLLAGSLADRRLKLIWFLAFSAIALLVSGIGLFGLVSYSVRERFFELGIRLALGAGRRNVLGLIVREGLLLAILGMVGGTGSSFVLTRYLRAMLYGASGIDPLTLFAVITVLMSVFLVATYLPARAATRQDWARTLRRQ
ncbi:MAG TPA: ABC transporter permease, partial [Blastocatellia bacterium]